MAKKLSENPTIDTYREGFEKPKLIEHQLTKTFKPSDTVFVVSMGDLFGSWVPDEWIGRVLTATKRSPGTTFFFETKNPVRYYGFLEQLPKTAIISTTIETNRQSLLDGLEGYKAPPVEERRRALRDIGWPRKHVSVEPIMDFDLDVMASWVVEILTDRDTGKLLDRPIASVGYDTCWCRLPEPTLAKTNQLIKTLEGKGVRVERKKLRERWF